MANTNSPKTLKGFLKPLEVTRTEEVIISDRFTEDGTPDSPILPFKIQTISQEENQALIEAHTERTVSEITGQTTENIQKTYQSALIVACCVEPNFKDSVMCSAYGTMNPLDVPNRMLHSGEFMLLAKKIMKLNGFKEPHELQQQAKNFSSAATSAQPSPITDLSTTE